MTLSRRGRLLVQLVVLAVVQAPPLCADERAGSAQMTLQECYRLALKRSEELAIHQERIKEAEGQLLQALSGALPDISFSSSDKWQDGSGSSAFTLRDVPDRRVTFSQPLFGGFKEFAAMAASRAQQRQRRHERARAEQVLLRDVSEAFYFLLQQRHELRTVEATRLALRERIDELKQREQLGRSRSSELASAEAQRARIEAEWERVQSLEVTSRHLLEFLTGLESVGALANEGTLPMLDAPSVYLARVGLRPDVQAAQEAWFQAKRHILVAQADVWPDVSVEGNYYTQRVGVSEDIDWDILLEVDVPIFQGGQVVGAFREGVSRARQAKLHFERTKREAELEIRDGYAQLEAALKQSAALQHAEDAAERNYQLQREDYTLNLVSNLDVLKALQELQDVRRDVIRARYEAHRLFWRLLVATGETRW
jgi:outer membrane protein